MFFVSFFHLSKLFLHGLSCTEKEGMFSLNSAAEAEFINIKEERNADEWQQQWKRWSKEEKPDKKQKCLGGSFKSCKTKYLFCSNGNIWNEKAICRLFGLKAPAWSNKYAWRKKKYQDRFMLLRYSFPRFPPHWRISWEVDSLKFSFKGFNGNPRTRDCSVSKLMGHFSPTYPALLQIENCHYEIKQLSAPLSTFYFGYAFEGLSLSHCFPFSTLQHPLLLTAQEQTRVTSATGKVTTLQAGSGIHCSQECIYFTGGGCRQQVRAQS